MDSLNKMIQYIENHLDMKIADEIVVLNNGKVEDIGVHKDLIKRCDTYKILQS